MKKTKVICTIGPSSITRNILKEMYLAGMNCARINTAHGDFPQYLRIIKNVRSISRVPIMIDIKGPEVRVLVPSPRRVESGERFKVRFKASGGIRFTYDFYGEVEVGDEILFSNGNIRTRIISKSKGQMVLESMNNGTIEDKKGVNIPGRNLKVPGLSEKDKRAISFAIKNKAEFIAISFVRNRKDVLHVKKLIGDTELGVISKIENFSGVENIPEIIDESDGIMIARGDLGVEIPHQRIPLIQKEIIRQCNQRGRIAVTATQMLDSMISSPTPTRAETSDVANAVIDGTDAVMLSGETAIGRYPIESVRTIAGIAKEVENSVPNRVKMTGYFNISDTISKSIHHITENMPLDKIVPITRSGYTARMIARFRLDMPIIAVTDDPETHGQLELVFGVKPVLIKRIPKRKRVLGVAEQLHSKGIIGKGETVLFTAGVRTSKKHASNLIEIHKIQELLKFSSS
ncbi:MAG: pyruvate kinase [Candidatus Micrarchaeota archaeon]